MHLVGAQVTILKSMRDSLVGSPLFPLPGASPSKQKRKCWGLLVPEWTDLWLPTGQVKAPRILRSPPTLVGQMRTDEASLRPSGSWAQTASRLSPACHSPEPLLPAPGLAQPLLQHLEGFRSGCCFQRSGGEATVCWGDHPLTWLSEVSLSGGERSSGGPAFCFPAGEKRSSREGAGWREPILETSPSSFSSAAGCCLTLFPLCPSEVVRRENNPDQRRDPVWAGVCGVCVRVCACPRGLEARLLLNLRGNGPAQICGCHGDPPKPLSPGAVLSVTGACLT